MEKRPEKRRRETKKKKKKKKKKKNAAQRLRRRSVGALSNRRRHDDRTVDHQSALARRYLLSPRFIIFFFSRGYTQKDDCSLHIDTGASGECNAAACLSALGQRNNGSLAAARLGRHCQCQCPMDRPIYREDLKQCVSTIDGMFFVFSSRLSHMIYTWHVCCGEFVFATFLTTSGHEVDYART